MAQCVKCEKKLGFFSKKAVRFVSPLCGDCSEQLQASLKAFVAKYGECIEKAPSDPMAAKWAAVANLVCAERVNVLFKVQTGSIHISSEETWLACKKAAINYAKMAIEGLAEQTLERAKVYQIIQRANCIQSATGPQHVEVHSMGLGLLSMPTVILPIECYGLIAGFLTIEDVDSEILSLTPDPSRLVDVSARNAQIAAETVAAETATNATISVPAALPVNVDKAVSNPLTASKDRRRPLQSLPASVSEKEETSIRKCFRCGNKAPLRPLSTLCDSCKSNIPRA